MCVCVLFHSYLRWQEIGRAEGISIPWQKVSLHAISSDPIKCIYVMLDSLVDYPASNGHGNGHDRMDEGNDNDDDEGTCEGELVSTKKNSLHSPFSIVRYVCLCNRRRSANDRDLVLSTRREPHRRNFQCCETLPKSSSRSKW